MQRSWLLVLVAFALAGCQTLSALTYSPDDRSGSTPISISLAFIPFQADFMDANALGQVDGVPTKIQCQCGVESACPKKGMTTFSGAFAVIIPLAGKSLFDFLIDKSARELDRAINAAQPPGVGVSWMGVGSALADVKCIAVLMVKRPFDQRNSGAEDRLATVAVFSLDRVSSRSIEDAGAFTLSPRYVATELASATTAATPDGKPPVVDMVFSFGLRGMQGNHLNGGQVASIPIAVETISLSKLPICAFSEHVSQECERPTAVQAELRTGPIPYPNPNKLVVFSVGIAERGYVPFDLKEGRAELEAIKNAIGPGIKETLTPKKK